MVRGDAVFELLRAIGPLRANKLYCDTCGHHLGQHTVPHDDPSDNDPYENACTGLQKDKNRNWCDCDGFALYYCDQPRLPTAEEIYESLR